MHRRSVIKEIEQEEVRRSMERDEINLKLIR
jgi:hypothetical protein